MYIRSVSSILVGMALPIDEESKENTAESDKCKRKTSAVLSRVTIISIKKIDGLEEIACAIA